MTALLTDNLPLLADAPNGIKKLRELILELAVRGKLVPQDPSDEPASMLLKRIAEEKARLVAEGKIKKQKALSSIVEEEKLFELPKGWEWQRLDDISPMSLVDGDWIESKDQDPSGGIRLLQLADIGVNEFKDKSDRFINAETFTRLNCTALEAGDILIARLPSPIGRACIFPGLSCNSITVVDVAVLRPLSTFCSSYVVNAINSTCFREQVEAYGKGATRFRIATGHLKTLLIPIPPLAEQQRIVAKVDELMALCDHLEAQQAGAESAHARLVQALLDSLTQVSDAIDFAANWQRLAKHFHTLFTTESSIDALKQTVLQLAVMGKLVPQNSSDEPVACLLEKNGIKSQPHMLQGWAHAPLGQLGEIIGGSTPSKANAEFWSGDIPWVSPKDMKRPVIQDSEDHISAKALAETSLRAVPPKSLLMVVRGMILVHSFPVALTAREVTINQDMKALVPPPEISDYLLMYLQAAKGLMVGLVDRSSHGTCKLISEKLWSHIASLPPLAEQHRIVTKVAQLMTLCDQLKTRLTQARQLNEQLASTLLEQAAA